MILERFTDCYPFPLATMVSKNDFYMQQAQSRYDHYVTRCYQLSGSSPLKLESRVAIFLTFKIQYSIDPIKRYTQLRFWPWTPFLSVLVPYVVQQQLHWAEAYSCSCAFSCFVAAFQTVDYDWVPLVLVSAVLYAIVSRVQNRWSSIYRLVVCFRSILRSIWNCRIL